MPKIDKMLADAKGLIDKHWTPYLAEMMLRDVELALHGQDAEAAKARERIYNRVWGKPVEVGVDSKGVTVNIAFHQVTTKDEAVSIVDGIVGRVIDADTLPTTPLLTDGEGTE